MIRAAAHNTAVIPTTSQRPVNCHEWRCTRRSRNSKSLSATTNGKVTAARPRYSLGTLNSKRTRNASRYASASTTTVIAARSSRRCRDSILARPEARLMVNSSPGAFVRSHRY